MEYIKLISNDGLKVEYKISSFEGELLELDMNPTRTSIPLEVGKEIICSFSGVEFNSRILKKNEDKLYVYAPLFQENIPNDRRKNRRLHITIPAQINDYLSEKVYQNTPERKIMIVDFSINGFGFRSEELLKINSLHYLYFQLNNTSIKTKVIIRNESKLEDGYRYGCEIQAITKSDFEILRKHYLLHQLKTSK